METETDIIFLDSKITAEGDCSHKIKRCLLFGRKIMTILDSILKSRDTTLLTKVRVVKATVFLVVMYGCKSWTINKVEHQGIDAFFTVVLEKTYESSLVCKEIKSVNHKGNQSWILTGKTDVEAPIFGHLMQRADSLEKTLILGKIEGRRKSGQQRMRWLDDSMDMSLSKL